MNKKLTLFILSSLVLGGLITLIALAIIKENFSHWWWISYILILLTGASIWIAVWLFKGRKKEEKPTEKKAEPLKGSVISYQKIVDKYWKHPDHINPDMLEVEDETAIPFPSEENTRMMIIPVRKVNLRTKMLLAIGVKLKKVESSMLREEGNTLEKDIEKFKLLLKPKLESITETTEEDKISGRIRSTKTIKPLLIEAEMKKRFEAEKEKEKEKERLETMESTKKEEKK